MRYRSRLAEAANFAAQFGLELAVWALVAIALLRASMALALAFTSLAIAGSVVLSGSGQWYAKQSPGAL